MSPNQPHLLQPRTFLHSFPQPFLQSMELLFRKTRNNIYRYIKNISIVTAIALILLLVLIIRLNSPIIPQLTSPLPSDQNSEVPVIVASNQNIAAEDIKITDDREKCDIFNGEWVPNPDAPYYTNTSCWAIHEHQNCMKYGRPDSDFMKWKWKPYGCDLPVLNPFQFLDIVRGKSLAIVGDSVGRNQLQSMICLLSMVSNL